jgi:predicted HAD superfamily hydrolase
MLIDVSRIDVFRTQNRINLLRTDVSKVDIEESKEYNQEIQGNVIDNTVIYLQDIRDRVDIVLRF